MTNKMTHKISATFLLGLSLASASLQAQNNLTTTGTQRYFNTIRRSLEASSDVMPAEKYNFRLTDAQMTFGEWMIHSAQRNFADCAVLKSETAPKTAAELAALKDKADVSKALKDSFAYCAAAIEGIDDQKVLSSPQMSNAFLHIIVHNNEIYGNVVGYLRSSGILPAVNGRAWRAKRQAGLSIGALVPLDYWNVAPRTLRLDAGRRMDLPRFAALSCDPRPVRAPSVYSDYSRTSNLAVRETT